MWRPFVQFALFCFVFVFVSLFVGQDVKCVLKDLR